MWGLTAKAGLPPTTLSGQAQTTKPTTFAFKTPNNQSTQTSGIESLIETGNSNILSDASFEKSTISSDWSNTGTELGLAENSVVIAGLKSWKFVPSAETIIFKQSSTLYAAQFADGVQGLAMVRIKSDIALSVCAIQAGTVSTTDCVTTATDSKWGLYKIPFILGATSNGISIASSGSVTGTVYIDDSFVGAASLIQDAPIIGPWTTFTPTGSFTTNTTYTGKYRQVGQDVEVLYHLAFAGAPNTTASTLNLPVEIDTAYILHHLAFAGAVNVSAAAPTDKSS